jgi:hypothetical protein
VARALGVVHAQVVAHDRRVVLDVLDVLQPAVQQLALPVHRCVVQGAAHALRERALVLVLGGLTRRHALVRHRQVR